MLQKAKAKALAAKRPHLGSAQRKTCDGFSIDAIRSQFAARPGFFAKHWSVENAVNHKQAALSPQRVLGGHVLPEGAWYCSSILQDDEEALGAFTTGTVPFAEPELLDAEHDDGVWLFMGANPPNAAATGGTAARGKRRKVEKRPKPAAARAAAPPSLSPSTRVSNPAWLLRTPTFATRPPSSTSPNKTNSCSPCRIKSLVLDPRKDFPRPR